MSAVTKPMALDETLKATNIVLGLIKDAINATGSYPTANNVSYDNTESDLDATNVQDAVDELDSKKANITDIPTKTSELTNDSNFVSDSNYVHTDNNFTTTEKNKLSGIEENANNYSLPTASNSVLGGIKVGNNLNIDSNGTLNATDTTYSNATTSTDGLMSSTDKKKLNGIESGAQVNVQSDWNQSTTSADDFIKNKPTKLSDFTNDSNFIDNTVNNLINYYVKSDTYTKTEVNSLISSIITLNILVVQSLPTTDISQTTIYLVPKTTAKTQDVYDEYINIDGTTQGWEKIGNTEIDLSNYYTITQVDSLLNGKVDKETGKGLSQENFTTTLKNKLDGIEANANNYSLPTADTNVLGGVKINGNNLSIDANGILSATDTTYNSISKSELTTGTSTTKRTVTASVLKGAIIDIIYPVGSIYTSAVNTNPSSYFGGTWVSVVETLLVANTGTTNTTQYKWRRTA